MKKYIKYDKYKSFFNIIFSINREQRRFIVDKLNNHTYEIEFLNGVLKTDNKNYHAWSYRLK